MVYTGVSYTRGSPNSAYEKRNLKNWSVEVSAVTILNLKRAEKEKEQVVEGEWKQGCRFMLFFSLPLFLPDSRLLGVTALQPWWFKPSLKSKVGRLLSAVTSQPTTRQEPVNRRLKSGDMIATWLRCYSPAGLQATSGQ